MEQLLVQSFGLLGAFSENMVTAVQMSIAIFRSHEKILDPATARLMSDFQVGNPLFSTDDAEHFGAVEIIFAPCVNRKPVFNAESQYLTYSHGGNTVGFRFNEPAGGPSLTALSGPKA